LHGCPRNLLYPGEDDIRKNNTQNRTKQKGETRQKVQKQNSTTSQVKNHRSRAKEFLEGEGLGKKENRGGLKRKPEGELLNRGIREDHRKKKRHGDHGKAGGQEIIRCRGRSIGYRESGMWLVPGKKNHKAAKRHF